MLKELELAGAVSVFAGRSGYATAIGAGVRHPGAIGAAVGCTVLLLILGYMLYRCL
jgi:hypothetical protein